jgi:hypothetical protein
MAKKKSGSTTSTTITSIKHSDRRANISIEEHCDFVDDREGKDKAAKVAAAPNLWIPAINNHSGFGRWAFLEVTDPWNAKSVIDSMFIATISE